jgi:hypothetical protein
LVQHEPVRYAGLVQRGMIQLAAEDELPIILAVKDEASACVFVVDP